MYPGIHARVSPDRPAIIMGSSGEVVTYADLDRRSTQLAHLLRSAGLRRGDHLAIFMENHPRFLEAAWAGMRIGLYVTTVNSHLTAEEASYIVDDCGAAALVTSVALGDKATEVVADRLRIRLMVGGTRPGFDSYETMIHSQPDEALTDEALGSPMLYSSGTTGRPKGVLRPLPDSQPSEDPDGVLDRVSDAYGFREEMVYLSPAPLYHSAPFNYCLTVQRLGGTVVVMERFEPTRALELIDEHRVTHSQWVPTMFKRLLSLPEEQRTTFDLTSHEVAIHAAAPCPVALKQQVIAWWGPILHEYYAATEGMGSTRIDSQDWLDHPGSVGRAAAGTIHIIGDDGEELGPGEPGTIYFSGGGQFEYHNDPTKTAETQLDDSLRTVGDVGYLDEDGWLYLTDRKAYQIVSGGVNIYPQEIENVLSGHPSVADVAVFGVPSEEFGEEVKAVIEVPPGIEPDESLIADLMAYCRAHLARYKCPRSIDFEPELPRLPTGKLCKRLLRDRYWEGHGTRII